MKKVCFVIVVLLMSGVIFAGGFNESLSRTLPAGTTIQLIISAPSDYEVIQGTTPVYVSGETKTFVIPRSQLIGGYVIPVSSSTFVDVQFGNYQP